MLLDIMLFVSKIKTFLFLIFGWILFFLSCLIPRSSKIVVFNGWHSNFEREIFADNSKYFFLYLSHNRPDIKTVWIGTEKNSLQFYENKDISRTVYQA